MSWRLVCVDTIYISGKEGVSIVLIDRQILQHVVEGMIDNPRRSVKRIRELAETEENYLIIMREIDRLEAQFLRARRLHVEVTLTIIEWFEVLEYFHWKCAYCQIKPFQVMSHIVPLPQKGVTRQNCIPACCHCRGSKQKEYTAIRKYLALFQQPSENGDQAACSDY